MKQNRRIIGLTGGIGTGKSTVAKYLAEKYHLTVIDADRLAKEAVTSSSFIFNQIVERYGQEICLEKGQLNRQKLGEIIFNNPTEKHWLESQIHPFVRQKLEEGIKSNSPESLVLVIPLLFEAKMTDLVTEIWVVTCPISVQIERIIQRNSLNSEQAIARINSQWPLSDKVALADIVINNSGTLEALWQEIEQKSAKITDITE